MKNISKISSAQNMAFTFLFFSFFLDFFPFHTLIKFANFRRSTYANEEQTSIKRMSILVSSNSFLRIFRAQATCNASECHSIFVFILSGELEDLEESFYTKFSILDVRIFHLFFSTPFD